LQSGLHLTRAVEQQPINITIKKMLKNFIIAVIFFMTASDGDSLSPLL
jgi:hypothetical protein